MRWRELFGCGLAMVLCLVLACVGVARAGVQAGFQSSTDPCGNDPSLVFCYRGDVDTSGNLVDHSGENLSAFRTDFGSWTEAGTCTVTANQWRNPVDGALDADKLDNTAGTHSQYRWRLVEAGTTAGDTYTYSVWIRADYNHVSSISLEDAGGILTWKDVNVTNTWQRFSVTEVLPTGGNLYTNAIPGEYGVSTGTSYFYGADVIRNDRYRTNQGIYLNPTDQSITKPTHDLAPTNAPTRALSDAEYQGNRLPARSFVAASTQYYSKAHHDSMNVNDTDHTYTFYVLSDDTGTDSIFGHSGTNVDGLWVYDDNSRISALYYQGGGSATVQSTAGIFTSDQYHILQVVRDSNTATVYVNGVSGTPVDVTGYGLDGSRVMYIGARVGAALPWDGDVAFAKLEAFARNADELASDREKIWGMATGQGSSFAAWDIARSTVAMKTFKAGGAHIINKKMTEVAANIPRVTLEGLLVEGQSTNICLQSEDFNTTWGATRASVITNTAERLALDGSQTVDILHEDATAADTHYIQQDNISTTVSEVYTYTVNVEANNRSWVRIYRQQDGPDAFAYFDLSLGAVGTTQATDYEWVQAVGDGVYRVGITWTASLTEAAYIRIMIAEADNDVTFDGLNQDSLYIWGAQFENSSFPTSHITTFASPVTRTGDDITMDPCADAQSCVLPLAFGGAGEPDKLTIKLDAKCDFSGVANVSADRYLLSISGNAGTATSGRNRLRLYVADNGRAYIQARDDSSTNHTVYSAVDPVDFSEWHTYWAVIDFADLSRMDFWIDGSNAGLTYSGNSGAAEFDLSGTKIRIGQQYDGTVSSNCRFRKGHPLVWAGELRP